MRQRLLHTIGLLISICVLLDGAARQHHYRDWNMSRRSHGRRIHRQIPHYPTRNEISPRYCNKREFHVICGPEKHCDLSCDNLYSPPNCHHDPNTTKCYFPRCLCKKGFVRDKHGLCVREHQCTNTYSEHTDLNISDSDGLMEFVPYASPLKRPRVYRHARHRHHSRHLRDTRTN